MTSKTKWEHSINHLGILSQLLLVTLLVRTQGLLLVINCTTPTRIAGSEVSQQVVLSHKDVWLHSTLPWNCPTGNWFSSTSFWDKAKATRPELARHHEYWKPLQLLQWIQIDLNSSQSRMGQVLAWTVKRFLLPMVQSPAWLLTLKPFSTLQC